MIAHHTDIKGRALYKPMDYQGLSKDLHATEFDGFIFSLCVGELDPSVITVLSDT